MSSDSFDEETFSVHTKSIVSAIMNIDLTGERLVKLITALTKVQKISNFSVILYESDGKTQIPVKSTLGSLLEKTLVNNFHSIRDKCQAIDKSKSTVVCKHGNPLIPGTDEHLFQCDYHMYDSVSIHLTLACLYNALWAIDNEMSDDIIMKAALLGLYHDIGKPITVEAYEFKNSLITGFPAHAEIGAMIFQAHWTPDMEILISYNDYMTISNAILRHMCGYHGSDNISNKYKRNLLLVEQPQIRALLCINRIGDHFGKLTLPDPSEPDDHFLKEQSIFEAKMKDEKKFSLPTILSRSTNKYGKIRDDKIVLYLIGTSGAGKSYFVENLMKLFPDDINVVSRDECIAAACVNVQQRLEGMDYVMMYKIYDAGKTLSRSCGKGSKGGKHDAKLISEALHKFIDAQNAWNTYLGTSDRFPKIKPQDPEDDTLPDVTAMVQALFEAEIKTALTSDKTFLIIDTFMNCFPQAIDNAVPKELAKCFRVHIHIQSYLERTDTSIAANLADQLKISGPYGIDMPMHPDGFRSGHAKKAFACLSSEINTEGPLPNSTFKSQFRPHYVAGICIRTPMGGNVGYMETYDLLIRLSQGMVKRLGDMPRILPLLRIADFKEDKDMDALTVGMAKSTLTSE
jgi:hypothetical protein